MILVDTHVVDFSCFNFQVRVFTAVISALLIIEYMSLNAYRAK